MIHWQKQSPTEAALLHNCKPNQKPCPLITPSSWSQKHIISFFSTLFSWSYSISSNCTGLHCKPWYWLPELVHSHVKFLKSFNFRSSTQEHTSLAHFSGIISRLIQDNTAWTIVTIILIPQLPLPALHPKQRQPIAPKLGLCSCLSCCQHHTDITASVTRFIWSQLVIQVLH